MFLNKQLKKSLKGETVVFKIGGMHCAGCAMNIDGALEELEGVVEARTNYARAEVEIVYKGKVNLKIMRQTITNLGYKIIN